MSLGEPTHGRTVKTYGNCEVHSWLNQRERDTYMRNAKLVIFSGGLGTCFEVIKHGKPCVCVPTQPEQMGNARKLQEMGCGLSVKTERQLMSAVLEIEGDFESYKRSVLELQEYSSRFNGVEKAVEVIESAV